MNFKIIILIIFMFVLNSCGGETNDNSNVIVPDAKTYRLPTGWVYEFNLETGEKCVAHTVGGITCSWNKK